MLPGDLDGNDIDDLVGEEWPLQLYRLSKDAVCARW